MKQTSKETPTEKKTRPASGRNDTTACRTRAVRIQSGASPSPYHESSRKLTERTILVTQYAVVAVVRDLHNVQAASRVSGVPSGYGVRMISSIVALERHADVQSAIKCEIRSHPYPWRTWITQQLARTRCSDTFISDAVTLRKETDHCSEGNPSVSSAKQNRVRQPQGV